MRFMPNCTMRPTFHHTHNASSVITVRRAHTRVVTARMAATPIVSTGVRATNRRWPNQPATAHDSTIPDV